MTIRAIIFDLGGVLVRTEDDTLRNNLANHFGMTRKALEDLIFMGASGDQAQRGEIDTDQHWENVRQKLNLSPDELRSFVDDFFGGDRLDTQLIDAIRSLKEHYKTALLSNAFSNLRHFVTQVWKIDDVFDEMVISSEVGVVKPDKRIYRIVLERLGVAADEAVFIDDFIHNVEGAKAVNMHAIHFRSREQALAELDEILKGA